MSDADCTPGCEPRSVAASLVIYLLFLYDRFHLMACCASDCFVSDVHCEVMLC